jgi:tRNA A37 N6-isopentenylltransferase MiaA
MNNSTQRPIVILGPTTVGKTDVAFGLARCLGAEAVNADKFYLYDAMHVVTGQSDAHLYPDVRTHLYGVLKIEEPRWNESRYSDELKACVRDIRRRRHAMVLEGCSNGLIRAAVDVLNASATSLNERPLLVGLRWKSGTNLSADCERRAASMMAKGMPREYRRALADGYSDTYAVQKCFARVPLMAHLRGQIGAIACQKRIAEELEHHARRHYAQLTRIPHVRWIEHNRQHTEDTIRRILEIEMNESRTVAARS